MVLASSYRSGSLLRPIAASTFLLFALVICLVENVHVASQSIEYRTFYISSIRGNDSLAYCTYEQPCATLRQFYRDYFRGPSVELRILSGEYSFRNLTLDQTDGTPLSYLKFHGQRDCWPAPENSTICTGADAIVSEITIFESRLQGLDISNLVFRPNQTATNGTSLIIDPGTKYISSVTVYNITIDANHSVAPSFQMNFMQYVVGNGTAISGVRFINTQAEPQLIIYSAANRLLVEGLTSSSSSSSSDSSSGVALSIFASSVINSCRLSNSNLSNLSILPENTDVNLLQLDNLSVSLKNSNNPSSENVVPWFRSVYNTHISNCRFENFATFFAAANLTIESSSFIRSFINVSTHTFVFNYSRSISLWENEFHLSSFMIDSFYVSLARENRFESGYKTVEGVELAPFILYDLGNTGPDTVHSSQIDARGNWWGQSTGPSTCCNPSGTGAPVLWLTPFDPWCIDPQCEHLSSNVSISAFLPSMKFENMSACFSEVFCPAETPIVAYITPTMFFASLLASVIVVIVLMIRRSENPVWKYRRILSILAIASIIAGASWLITVLFISPSGGRNAVAAYAAANLHDDKLLLILASSIFITSVQHLFVYLAVESIIIIAGLILTEAVLPSIRILYDTYPLRYLSILLIAGKLPSPNMWLFQGLDTFVITLFNIAILIFIRQVLQARDFVDLTDVSRDVSARAALLGTTTTTILQGDKTLRPSRRIAWFNVIRILILPVATTLLLLANVVPGQVSNYAAIVSGAHELSSLVAFVLFFWFNYRPVFLMTSAAVTACLGLIYLGFVVYFDVLYFTFDYRSRSTDQTRPNLVIPANVFGILVVLTDLIAAIWEIRYTIWASPILAVDINTTFQRHLEGLYG